jgi:hypothetical protein
MAPLLTTPPDSPDLSLPESGWDLHIGRGSRAETTGWRPALEVHTGDGLIDVAVAGGLDQTLLRGALRGRRSGRRQGRWGTARGEGRWALAWGHLPAGPDSGPQVDLQTGPQAGPHTAPQAGPHMGPQADLHGDLQAGTDPGIGATTDPHAGSDPGSSPSDPYTGGPRTDPHTGGSRSGPTPDPYAGSGSGAVEVIVEFRTRRTTRRVKATAIAGAFWVAEAPGGFRSVAVSTGPRQVAARLRRYRPGH